uniref:Uncharacterized protein n=1 Tax=Arundo donax TaxID=35708 RepID=A0A0A8ZEB1_ARUDO
MQPCSARPLGSHRNSRMISYVFACMPFTCTTCMLFRSQLCSRAWPLCR